MSSKTGWLVLTALSFQVYCLGAAQNTWAGVGTSGGGAATVCRDSSGAIKSAELLDLYEGVQRFGMRIPRSSAEPSAQVSAVLSRFRAHPYYGAAIRQQMKSIMQGMVFLPKGVGLYPGADLGSQYGVVVPEGCQLEYAGYYEADGTLRVSPSVYSALSSTDRAALLVHEAVYKIARDYSLQTDSSNTRHLVAAIFADSTTETDLMTCAMGVFAAGPDRFLAVVPEGKPITLRVNLAPDNLALRNNTYFLQCIRSANSNNPRNIASKKGSGLVELFLSPSEDCYDFSASVMPETGRVSPAFNMNMSLASGQSMTGQVPEDGVAFIHIARDAMIPVFPVAP